MANNTGPAQSGSARRLLLWGSSVSVMYLAGLGGYAWNELDHMRAMSPDEFATFLSGAFAPLAFLWLVLGFKQQGDELQNSARALWLQGEELRNSVEQQKQLVEVSREQLLSDFDVRRQEEQEADRTAQPRFYFGPVGIERTGKSRVYTFRFTNKGPTCHGARFIVNGVEVGSSLELATGETRGFQVGYTGNEDVHPLAIIMRYFDSRDNRREQEFFVSVDEAGDPQGIGYYGQIIRLHAARPVEFETPLPV